MAIKRTYQNEPKLKLIRRSLRQNQTTAEKILWTHLRNKQLGYKFRRQFSIGNFVVDFYCHEAKLVIELDGWTHDSELTQTKDARKQSVLETNGYFVLRFRNEQVFEDLEGVLNEITKTCQSRTQ